MAQAMLDCGQCGTRKYTTLNEEHIHSLQSDDSVQFFCDHCRRETAWNYASYDRRGSGDRRLERRREASLEAALQAEAAPVAPVAGPPSENPYADLARSFLLDQRARSDRRAAQQRNHRRTPLELPLRVTSRMSGKQLQETTRTVNVCRTGVYFRSELSYQKDLPVGIELNYSDAPAASNLEQRGVVVRIDPLPATSRHGVAVKLN